MATCRYEPWSLKDLATALNDMHVDRKQIVVPMFQRGKRWKSKQEDAFIDSLLKGYPVGTMLFYRTVEDNKEIYTLVDGLQRGNTIKKFMASPTKYFKSENIPTELVDNIFNILGLKGQESKIKNGISSIIVNSIHSWSTYNGMQYYPIAKEILSVYPTTANNAIDDIIGVLQPFLDKHKSSYEKIANTTIPVIVYSGDEDTLPDIFDRINSKGTPLSTYEVFAASWPINNKFKVNNSEVINRVLRKYDTLADDNFSLAGYNRDELRKSQKLNAFEYLFGLSRYLNDKYSFLKFDKTSEDDVINPMAFELVNACLNETNDTIKTLYNNILTLDINQFEEKLIAIIEFVEEIIKPITRFKGNKRGSEKILHSKYQILSMISTTFKEKYDVNNNCLVRSTWKESRSLLKKNMLQHYVCDIIESEWNDGGTSKIHKAAKPNKYLNSISILRWETVLNSYFEQSNSRQESKKIANPSKEDIVILNCIYLPLFTAMDQLSLENFDIEHIATKDQMKQKISRCKGLGLPISSIANLCYLPQTVNRSKRDKTFYQDSNYLKYINLSEIESKYSFTEEQDMEWLDLQYLVGDFEVLKDYYFAFLKRRFKKQKEVFFKAFGIESINIDDVEEESLNTNLKSESTIINNNNSDIEINTIIKSPSAFHNLCARSINTALNISLHKVNRRLYASEDNETGIIISVSKAYKQGNRDKYWFAYHTHFRDDLEKFKNKYIAFGCGSEKNTLLLPISDIENKKIKLNHTSKDNRIYWHIVFFKDSNNKWTWLLSKPELEEIDITDKLI
ncbi:DUF262 domain-containing protein [Bacillus sp. APMAM]|nr:DUF262 domain-containing protein [Bacillus sp. APMAM]RTZ55583.1 DUF262 domain-containing protein [Bacillus sp. SAJ1]